MCRADDDTIDLRARVRAVRAPIRAGQVLAGRYRVRSVLGEGAFGQVLAGRRLADGAEVALKLPRADASGRELRLLRQEGGLLQRAQHRCVVRLLDLERAPDAMPYLAMELLRGPSLAHRLESGPLAIAEVLSLARDMLSAIHAFSPRGVVHRDLKPANVMWDDRTGFGGAWKVIDFGIAVDVCAVAREQGTAVVGTPRYMAPEQLRCELVDVRTDLYALGALLYEAITGEPCHGRGSAADAIASTLYDRPLPLHDARPDCPLALERLVLRALARDPRDRPQSAREMFAALKTITCAPAPRRPWTTFVQWLRGPRVAAATSPTGEMPSLAA